MVRPNLKPEERIIVALDLPFLDEALDIVDKLDDTVQIYKVGPILFLEKGTESLNKIKAHNKNIFLDLKFHDIPSTVEKSIPNILDYGISMFTIHTLGGFEMVKSVSNRVKDEADKKGIKKPLVLGVTVLTSHLDETLEEVGISNNVKEQVLKLASVADKAGLDGLVCSGFECEMIRNEFGERFTLVVPGIRPDGENQDQKRVVTPKDAINMGADYLVIGRAITESDDPQEIVRNISNSIF